jgi:hypothetical protein
MNDWQNAFLTMSLHNATNAENRMITTQTAQTWRVTFCSFNALAAVKR